MPGPNSAPNRDKRLVVGYSDMDYVLTCAVCKKGPFILREHLAFHETLRTGKTRS